MKKLLLTMLAFCTLWTTANATLILHESFDKDAGQLTVGRAAVCNDSTKWWSLKSWTAGSTSPTDPIMVTEGSLSYAGYVAAGTGNKAQLNTIAGTADVRRFKDVTSGSVYAAAIINMTKISSSSLDQFFGVCDGTSNYYGRVYAKEVTDGYQLAIAKYTDSKDALPYTSTLSYNTNYLIVVEYVCKEGTRNDSVNLWVNPTKSTTTPTLVCNMTQANTKNDPSKLAGVYLFQSVNAPTVAVDEIKVATAWADLFESGDAPDPTPTATITTSPKKLAFGGVYTDGTQHSLNFTVSGTDLTGDITLASDNAELVLDKTTLTKAEAEADGGAKVTATLTAVTAGEQTATITLSSTGATPVTIAASWTAVAITKSATIAELKTGIAADDGTNPFLLTGEAVVTYSEAGSYGTMYYVEDATGAVRIDEWFSAFTLNVGDKIKDAIVYKGDEAGLSGQPLAFNAKPTIVSTGNEWTPQVVTLKDLQDNAADYLLELVKVEGVTLDNTEANYKAGNNAISQNGTSGAIGLTSDNTLVGTVKPAKADIVGISYYTSGYNIRVRTAADIVAKTDPTSIETISLDQLTGEYEIYTVSGQRTNALQAGVNIIRQGDKTYKVIR